LGVFEDLRKAFREAVGNFRTELHRDEIPETVDRLLYGMKEEAAAAKSRIWELEKSIASSREEAALHAREAETCRRRETMAASIGDEETAKIAGDFAAKHEQRKQVLDLKVEALGRELTMIRADFDEMVEKIKEAEKKRDGLAASAGRTQAKESMRAGDDLFAELDRMTGGSSSGSSSAAFDEDPLADIEDPFQPRPGPDMDARLAELKKRMSGE
jgi:phage shock protein A